VFAIEVEASTVVEAVVVAVVVVVVVVVVAVVVLRGARAGCIVLVCRCKFSSPAEGVLRLVVISGGSPTAMVSKLVSRRPFLVARFLGWVAATGDKVGVSVLLSPSSPSEAKEAASTNASSIELSSCPVVS
jgi:hypothetical protein